MEFLLSDYNHILQKEINFLDCVEESDSWVELKFFKEFENLRLNYTEKRDNDYARFVLLTDYLMDAWKLDTVPPVEEITKDNEDLYSKYPAIFVEMLVWVFG